MAFTLVRFPINWPYEIRFPNNTSNRVSVNSNVASYQYSLILCNSKCVFIVYCFIITYCGVHFKLIMPNIQFNIRLSSEIVNMNLYTDVVHYVCSIEFCQHTVPTRRQYYPLLENTGLRWSERQELETWWELVGQYMFRYNKGFKK